MKTTIYRDYTIMTDGYCFYVAIDGDEYPFDTIDQARAAVDAWRYERTLNRMARDWR